MLRFMLSIAFLGTMFIQNANAYIVLQDNFDSDTAVLNWPGDSVFQSVIPPGSIGTPSVDLVGVGDGFGNLAFSGNSVDLDGTTGSGNYPAGSLQSVISLPKGTYVVSFELAGNLRQAPAQITVVQIGNTSFTFDPAANQGYMLETVVFYDVSGHLSFTDLGPSDQQGNLLDNVVVSTTPLPSTWTMLIAGFAGLAFFAYRGTKKNSATRAAA
jgi:hypothetical protein